MTSITAIDARMEELFTKFKGEYKNKDIILELTLQGMATAKKTQSSKSFKNF